MPPKALFYYYAVAYVFVFTAYYFVSNASVSYTHLTLPTIYSV